MTAESVPTPAPRPNPLKASVAWFERVGTSPVTARPFAEQLHREVYGPELARLRDEATEAHSRNIVLRDEHRQETAELAVVIKGLARGMDKMRVQLAEAIYCATDLPWDEVIVEARSVASQWLKRGAELDEFRASRGAGNTTPADARTEIRDYLTGWLPSRLTVPYDDTIAEISMALAVSLVDDVISGWGAVTNPTDGAGELQANSKLEQNLEFDGMGRSVYVRMRDGDVDRSECVNACITLDRDANGGLLGVEVLGAAGVEIDGSPAGPVVPAPTEDAKDFDPVFVHRVLALFDFDNTDDLWWRADPEYAPVTFFAKCSDIFHWGCSDLETITPADLPLLEQTATDLKAVKDGDMVLAELFAARKRGMRPQGAVYKDFPEGTWPLFDACGPVRETGLGNPHAQPAVSERERAQDDADREQADALRPAPATTDKEA